MHRMLALALLVCAFTSGARADTYVVLPFFNLTKNSNLDWIGESLAESIRDALVSENLVTLDRDARIEALHRLSIRPYAVLTRASVIKIAETLDAEKIIYGHFDLKPPPPGSPASKGGLQITSHLLDLKHLKQGPEIAETGSLEDLGLLERHVAWKTLQFAEASAAPSEEIFNRRTPSIRLDAIENYTRGLLAAKPEEKHHFFTQAVRLDATFSQPSFQLGKLHFAKNEYKSAAEWFQKVSPRDPHYREANFLLGLCLYNSGEFAQAQNAFQEVAKTVPLNEVLNDIGAAQSRRNAPEALDNFKKALDGDPNDADYQFNVGYALWKRADFEAAAQRFKAALQRDPGNADATAMLDRCVKKSGPRPGDTKTERLERLKTNYEESAWWQLKAALQPEKQ